jgi:hypothetical protein
MSSAQRFERSFGYIGPFPVECKILRIQKADTGCGNGRPAGRAGDVRRAKKGEYKC